MMQMQIESTECFTEYLVHNSYHSSGSILLREIGENIEEFSTQFSVSCTTKRNMNLCLKT